MIDNRLYYPQQPLQPTTPVNRPSAAEPTAATTSNPKTSFDQILQQQLTGIKFSQHAAQRLESRNIKLSPAELGKIGSAIDKASQKGARESLILMNDLALVVSVKNKTVITALNGSSIKENVFTNIDSAVII